MSYLEILQPDELCSSDLTGIDVLVGCSPDQVAKDGDPYTDWLGGYGLIRRPGESQHDGHPATLLTVHDRLGSREVGRVVLRNDALDDARLELVRTFVNEEARDDFVKAVKRDAEGTDEIKFVELDFAYDENNLDEALFNTLKDFDLTYRILNLKGPAGGWPVIKFTGTDRELRKFLRGPYTLDEEEIADYLGDVVPLSVVSQAKKDGWIS